MAKKNKIWGFSEQRKTEKLRTEEEIFWRSRIDKTVKQIGK